MWAIVLKEFRELSRDKRTLNFTVFVPTVFLPALIIGLAYYLYSYSESREESVLHYAVVGTGLPTKLREAFGDDAGFAHVAVGRDSESAQLLKEEALDFSLGASTDPSTGETLVKLYLGTGANTWVEKRVRERIDVLNERIRPAALEPLGLSVEEVRARWTPISLDVVDVRSEREEIGEGIAGILPYLLLIVCLVGAMYPAIDIAAGEKERGTLQTLVATPIPRGQIVGGKFLVTFTTSFVSGVLSIASILVWTVLVGQSVGTDYLVNALSVLGAASIALIGLLLVPLAAIFAALMLTISVYARSFKEAQSYAMPLNIIVFIPAIIVLMPDVVLDWKWALVPLTNVALAIKALLLGKIDGALLIITFVSSATVAGALLLFCVFWFQREEVLFREAV